MLTTQQSTGALAMIVILKISAFCFTLIICSEVALAERPQPNSGAGKQGQVGDDPVFYIADRLEFEGKIVHGPLRKSEIEPLLDLKVRNGDNGGDRYGAELTTDDGKRVRVSTCREYKRELLKGSYAATGYDMAMQNWLIHTCDCLYSLKRAGPTKLSFIAKPRIGLSNLNLLPVNMISSLYSDESEKRLARLGASGMTIGKLLSKHRVRIESRKKQELVLIFEDTRNYFAELARADVDGDGIEDILVYYVERPSQGGTFVATDIFLLTRRSVSASLKVKRLNLE